MQGKLTPAKIVQIVIVLALLLILVVYRTLQAPSKEVISAPLESSQCDISYRPCLQQVGELKVHIDSTLRPILPEQSFHIDLQGVSMLPTQAWIEGKSMFMGRIPLTFAFHGRGLRAEAMVGACTTDPMVWQLVVQWPGQPPLTVPFSVVRH